MSRFAVVASAFALLVLPAACGGDEEPERSETGRAGPRVLTTTQPGALDDKEAFLLTADLACRRMRVELGRLDATTSYEGYLEGFRRTARVGRRWLRRMDREGVPTDLPGARAYRRALAALTSVYVKGPAVVRSGDVGAAARLDARGTRAYRRLNRLSDRLGISGC